MASRPRLYSMTGFARAAGEDGTCAWWWEIRSVNGKGLEVRCRLPQGSEAMEGAVRSRAAERFKRGNVTVSLTLKRQNGLGQYRVNEALLRHLIDTVERIDADGSRFERPGLDVLLGVKGVVEQVDGEAEESEETRETRERRMFADLDGALESLVGMRADEGGRLRDVLAAQLDAVEQLCRAAAATAEAQPEAIRERLRLQVSELLANTANLPEDRIVQEAALLATRADVREEIDRLNAHIAAARQLMAEGGVVGRKLDFLCQELTREANTLCSKAADMELSRIGIELKTVIEQFREQVQNIE